MEKKVNRKPFVVPRLQEQASLVGVTLISGGGKGNPTGSLSARKSGNQGSGNRTA